MSAALSLAANLAAIDMVGRSPLASRSEKISIAARLLSGGELGIKMRVHPQHDVLPALQRAIQVLRFGSGDVVMSRIKPNAASARPSMSTCIPR